MTVTDTGPLIDDADVEDAVIATLQAHEEFYFRDAEIKRGLPAGTFLPITEYVAAPVFDYDDEKPPVVFVTSPGLRGAPERDGRGFYRVTFDVGVTILVADSSERKANRLAKRMLAPLKLLLLQHGSLGGIASGVRWVDGSNANLIDDNRDRQLAAAEAGFAVTVDGVLCDMAGPAPDAEPDTDGPFTDPISELPAFIDVGPL